MASMNATPLNVLIHERFATELSKALATQTFAIPPKLYTINDQSDSEIAAIMSTMEVFISGSFKSAWRGDQKTFPRLVHSVGAGIDGIDLASLPPGCKVCNVYGHERQEGKALRKGTGDLPRGFRTLAARP